ncbi:hypothetical protein QYF36_014388 [Acer negundo]|nr:hypothetical protein QYF36_014388 [Acer negundo]
MIPARNKPAMIGWNGNVGEVGSSSGLILCQPNMSEGQLLPLDMTQNTISKSEISRLIQEFDGTKSGNENHEGAVGNNQDQHSHTQHQIQEMES